ncbi:MAG TPA: efflux RND transporter permease subunit, partial [Gemmatimonadaceae bacterium]|nr:efflux RND transporter permease subunit [Gemmatimonadaceae bacterium]
MSSLFDLLAAQRRFIYLVIGLLSVAGVYAATRLPSAIYPELAFPRILVVAEGSSLGARQMVFSVTRPIEEAISIVPGVTRVRSRSIRGSAEISVTFADNADMMFALQQVQARVNEVRPQLPANINIVVERMTPSLFPIVSYNLEGGDPGALYDIALYQLKPLISRVPGVGRVDVQGSDVREVEVVADPARLAAQRLTYDDLANAIIQGTGINAIGRVAQDYKQYLIVSSQEAHTPEDIANVVVAKGLRVRDIATVTLGSI